MAQPRHLKIGVSRRRRHDDGEDDTSVTGQIEDDSLSEGSIDVHPDEDDADGEVSETSEHEIASNGHVNDSTLVTTNEKSGTKLGSITSDTEVMLNGLPPTEQLEDTAEIHFNDLKDGGSEYKPNSVAQKHETPAERRRREHDEYVKEREENPAFVPTRGGFFLHDKRSTDPDINGSRPSSKSKSRSYGMIVDGNIGRRPNKPDATEGQWAHDLHETLIQNDHTAAASKQAISPTTPALPSVSRTVPTAPRSSPPNRSFSTTVLLGNVQVVVLLPGMENPITHSAVPKRQYTRLPQHRPPLRRDKPVRISLPDQPPRYIFPSTERSFIFIPRALRPNQQSYRGRGRAGFYGPPPRTNFYASSMYSPSISMSRRSSFAKGVREGLHSPAGSVLSRQTLGPLENGKPVVRLPPSAHPSGGVYPPPAILPAGIPQHPPPPYSQAAPYRENRPVPIPMHQPKPQKAVSVADIESPAGLPLKPPQPLQEQPFHHQVATVPMPVQGPIYPSEPPYPHARQLSHPSQTSAITPLSHIPERAIHAQPFQPYGYPHPQSFYPTAYPASAVFYPVSGTEYPSYAAPASGPPPQFIPSGQQMPYVIPPPNSTGEQYGQSGTVAHEANGTVYFYDASQMYPNTSYATAPTGGVVGMGGMMTPPGPAYYYPQPQGMYYPTQ